MLKRYLVALPLLLLLALPAAAQSQNFVDSATGLKLDLPSGYVALAKDPSDNAISSVLVYGAGKTDGQPTCIIGVYPAPDNEAMSQAELNARTASPEWFDITRDQFGTAVVIESHDVVEQDGVAALGLTMSMPNEPDNTALSWRFDTPHGATSMTCPTKRDQLAANGGLFTIIREGVTPH